MTAWCCQVVALQVATVAHGHRRRSLLGRFGRAAQTGTATRSVPTPTIASASPWATRRPIGRRHFGTGEVEAARAEAEAVRCRGRRQGRSTHRTAIGSTSARSGSWPIDWRCLATKSVVNQSPSAMADRRGQAQLRSISLSPTSVPEWKQGRKRLIDRPPPAQPVRAVARSRTLSRPAQSCRSTPAPDYIQFVALAADL